MRYLIKNGRVLDPQLGLDVVGDVFIADGSIVLAGQPIGEDRLKTLGAYETIDAAGYVVAPAFVDIHCHLREPGFEHKETIATGAASAAAGGFATICCMPNTNPTIDTLAVLKRVMSTPQTGATVRPVAAITKNLAGKELTEMGELSEAGAVAFSDDGKCLADSRMMRNALSYSAMFGKAIMQHCEDLVLVDGGVMNEGPVSAALGLRGWPNAAEETIVARDIALVELTGGRLHLTHVSTAGSVRLIKQAKANGLRVTADCTPHHLLMTDQWVAGKRAGWPDGKPYDTNTRVNPPLRSEEDRLALIEALRDGTIDAIATDHAPHAFEDKWCEFDQAASGMVGFETALPSLLTLVQRGELDLATILSKLTGGPSRCLDLPVPSLKDKTDANVTIFDADEEWTIDPALFLSKGRNTPLAGLNVKGRVKYTFVAGELAYDWRGAR